MVSRLIDKIRHAELDLLLFAVASLLALIYFGAGIIEYLLVGRFL